MSRSLDGRVAIVTGGSREIGAAMADALAADGAAVVVSHHDAPDLAGEVASRIIDEGGRALAVQADLSHPTENRRLVERTVDEFGRLDVFVANAGVTKRKSFLEMDEETWDTLVDLNLKGAYFGAQAAARTIAAQRADDPEDSYGGRIVFSSSVNGLVAIPDNSAYAATKAALSHLATVLAVELGPHGITVNALAIGATVNERNLADDPDYDAHWAEVTPTGRVGTPQDVAAALAYLVSPGAAMVSGHTLTVDGGWSGVGNVP
ncbi:MAG: glucose 1-dehydrogenase [Actinobacteria bacterium]|nr:glucose 1-dehydrogenase [Actinomycetota bacterium]